MIIIGDKYIEYNTFKYIRDIKDIDNTEINSVLVFKFDKEIFMKFVAG